jgi:hypothetical protein
MKEGFTPTFSQTKQTKKAPPCHQPPCLTFFFKVKPKPQPSKARQGKQGIGNIRPGCYCIFKKLLYLCGNSNKLLTNKMLQSITKTTNFHNLKPTFKVVERKERLN